LGLGVDDASDLVQADYILSVEEVFETFVNSLLNRMKNRDVLSHLRTEQQQNLDLPSFVPDWLLNLGNEEDLEMGSWSMRCSILAIYDTTSGTPVQFEACPGILTVRGVTVDTVEIITIHTVDGVRQASGLSWNWSDFLDEAITMATVPPRDENLELGRHEVFWLTMVTRSQIGLRVLPSQLDAMQATQKVSESYDRLSGVHTDLYDQYEEFLRMLETEGSLDNVLPNDLYLFDTSIAVAQNGRKFMIMQGGRMGPIPKHAEEGDIVAVLTGGHVPMISKPKEGYYTVIGNAYVQGIRDGEAMQAAAELEYF
jgi:hypothetical protein